MHCLISSTQREEFAQSHTVLSPFSSKPDHMGELSWLARTDRQRVCLSAKSAPHSLTGCFYYRDRRLFVARQEQSKSRRLVAPSSKQKRESKGGEQHAREEKQVTAWGVSNVGVAAISPVDSIRSWMSFKREKNNSQFISFLKLLSLWTGDIIIIIFIIRQTLSSRTKFQNRAITKRKMWLLSSPLSQVTQFDESPFLQITAIVAMRILPNITSAKDDIKKEAYILQNLFLSYLWKSLALFDLMGHKAIQFNLSFMIWWSSL